jgi:hypothetical protein
MPKTKSLLQHQPPSSIKPQSPTTHRVKLGEVSHRQPTSKFSNTIGRARHKHRSKEEIEVLTLIRFTVSCSIFLYFMVDFTHVHVPLSKENHVLIFFIAFYLSLKVLVKIGLHFGPRKRDDQKTKMDAANKEKLIDAYYMYQCISRTLEIRLN